MPPKTYSEVLSKPFGPYPAAFILNFPIPSHLPLSDVSLWDLEGKQLGLDDVDSTVLNANAPSVPTYYFGTLEVDKLPILSDYGKKLLEKDLREHGAALREVYGQDDKGLPKTKLLLKVILHFTKAPVSTHFLTNDKGPEILLIWFTTTVARNQRYQGCKVLSMDAVSYKRSQNFLQRFRIHRFTEDLIKFNPNFPRKNRTLDWLVEQYLAKRPELHPSRLILDVEEKDRQAIENTPRRLRHVSRAEVIRALAPHAEWLLAQQLAPTGGAAARHQLLNIPEWEIFCRQIRAEEARQAGRGPRTPSKRPPGIRPHETAPADVDLGRYGITIDWRKKIQSIARKLDKPHEELETSSGQITPSRGDYGNLVYDPDFESSEPGSDVSSGYELDSVDEDPYHRRPQEVQALLNRVPLFCFSPPEFPPGRRFWRCPGEGCGFTLDVFGLGREREVRIPKAMQAVSDHYEEHVREKGVWYEDRWQNGQRRVIITESEGPRSASTHPTRTIHRTSARLETDVDMVLDSEEEPPADVEMEDHKAVTLPNDFDQLSVN